METLVFRAGSASIPPPKAKAETEISETVTILHMREEKLRPLFAVLHKTLDEVKTTQEREAIDKIISILEITPLRTIKSAERVIRYRNKRAKTNPDLLHCLHCSTPLKGGRKIRIKAHRSDTPSAQ